MWASKCCPRQHHEGRKSMPVVLRRSYGPARDDNNTTRSTHEVWNDNYCVRSGLWDDVLFQCSRNCRHDNKRRQNVSLPVSKVSTPNQHVRYKALAKPKTTGCGPNCKKSRCAATDPPYCYAKPRCAADKRRAKKQSPTVKKYTYSTMAHVQDKGLDLGRYDMTMGLKNIQKVEEPEEETVLPTCKRNCGECSEASRESAEEEMAVSRSGAQASGLQCLVSTRTVGSNTDDVSEDAEVPVQVLQDVSINTVLDRSEKRMPPVVPRLKIPTPIPRVAFLRPPRSRLKDVIEYDGSPILTPRLPTPRTPRPTSSFSPVSLTSRRMPSRRISPQRQKLVPGKLAPRLFTPPTTIHLSGTGNLSPRSPVPTKPEKFQLQPLAPPLQARSPPLQPFTPTPPQSSKDTSKVASKESSKLFTEQTSEQSSKESAKQNFEQSSKESSKKSSEVASKESSKLSTEQTSEQSSKESARQNFEQSSKESSKKSSKSDSLVTSISDFGNSTCSTASSNKESIPEVPTPVFCMCSLCGKCESINDDFQDSSAAIYRNNPLYSPARALTATTVQNNNTTSSRWKFLYTFLEILFLVVLAGVLTVALIPYVETVFRAHVADYCKCSAEGKGEGGPQVTADGMQSGVVKWVNCMIDDTRSTLTPVR